jgi:sarcosine oxidase
MPIYIWDLGTRGNFYGFPEQPGFEGTAKVAMHFAKLQDSESTNQLCQTCQPDTIERDVCQFEIKAMRDFLSNTIPTLNGELDCTATCMYTMTPDQHL